jgi:hypothetical protein
MKRNPYLFVVGCPRSGTTLLQRMLDNHPQLAVANDSHFIPRAIKQVGIGIDPVLTPELIEAVRTYHRFHRLGLSEGAVCEAASDVRSYAQFVSALYSLFARAHGKPLAGEKTPDYVKVLPLLHGLFPWVRTIHIIRDGRNVALSTLEWSKEGKGPSKFALWRREPVAVCALWWQWQVSAGMRDGARLGAQRYHEVKYEDLIVRTEEKLRELAQFLGLPFAVEMQTYHEGKVRHQPGLSAKNAWLPPTQGLRDWRSQMRARDLELFEALAGRLLGELRYERSADSISPEVADIAETCQKWWDSEMAQRKSSKAVSRDLQNADNAESLDARVN